jgi:hypothetical protein
MDKPKFNNAQELSDYIMAGNSNLKYSLHDRVEKLEGFVYSLQDQLLNLMQFVQANVKVDTVDHTLVDDLWRLGDPQ